MRIAPLLLLLSFWEIHSKAFDFISSQKSPLVAAVDTIVKEILVKKHSTINLISLEHENRTKVKDFIDGMLKVSFKYPKIIFRQETLKSLVKLSDRRRRCMLIVVADFKEFCEINEKISRNLFLLDRGFYVFALVNGRIPEIQEMFHLLWEKNIFEVVTAVETDQGKVVFETLRPFKPGNCNDTTPVVINEFFNGFFKHYTENLFDLESIKNLHGCPIRVATSNGSEPFVYVKIDSNGSLSLKGRDISLIKALSRNLNFTIEFTYIGNYGEVYHNGSFKGVFKALEDGQADLAIGDYWLTGDRTKAFGHTAPYISEQIGLIIPPGADYRSIRKFILPFAPYSWFLVLFVIFSGYLVIFITNHQSKAFQSFIFGRNIRNAYLNMLTALVGGSQNKLPRRNFARFLLVSFLLYSLVIRTAYQGSFYKILKTNQKHKEVQSIDEMIEKDFTFFLFEHFTDLTQSIKRIHER